MASNDLCLAPIWDDVSTLEGQPFRRVVDIVYGGFPCQDISTCGTGKGLAGERSGLFFQILRLAKEIKPQYVFLENVPAITTRGGLEVVREVAALGYDCRWCVISAQEVGAAHKRDRWFMLGWNANASIRSTKPEMEVDKKSPHNPRNEWLKYKPTVARTIDGLPYRVDRIRGLGNAVVPQQAKKAFEILMGLA